MAPRSAPKPFSLRLDHELHRRLDEARRPNESKSRLVEELIDEGLRMRRHPGIAFREGPAGRRAALVAGPDVWEVIETLAGTGQKGEKAIAATAAWGDLTVADVRAALGYYGDHQEEIDGWIAANRAEAERLQASWERSQQALA